VTKVRPLREIRLVELIVQPAAKDPVGEMGVRGKPCGQPDGFRVGPNNETLSAARACGVEMAKVHVETFYFPSPVTRHKWQVPLRTVAQHPTGINLRMTEGIGNREGIGQCRIDCARSINPYPAVGQTPGYISQHLPIPPYITNAATHCAEPVDFCLVIDDRRSGHKTAKGRGFLPTKITCERGAVFFDGTLEVGLKPYDNQRGILPIVADLTTTNETAWGLSVGETGAIETAK
jgi:hypothetical protein